MHPREPRAARAGDARSGAVHARGHRGAARVLRDPGRGPRGVHPRPRLHARPTARAAALAEAPDGERRGHRRAHRRPRLAPLHPACRHRGRGRGRPRHPPARAPHARGGRGRRRASGTRAASSCPTSTSVAKRSPATSRRASAAWAPPRSRCCSATPSRPPSGAPGSRRERRADSLHRSRRRRNLSAVRDAGRRPTPGAAQNAGTRWPASATAPVPTPVRRCGGLSPPSWRCTSWSWPSWPRPADEQDRSRDVRRERSRGLDAREDHPGRRSAPRPRRADHPLHRR